MSFTEKKYLKFRGGARNFYVLLDALHAAPESRRREFFTDEIADRVSSDVGCHCIIAKVPREKADLNQFPTEESWPAVNQYRDTIRYLLQRDNLINQKGEVRFPFLHISLHGMRNRSSKDVELGTFFGESCSPDVLHWLLRRFRSWATELNHDHREPIVIDNDRGDALYGHPVIATHRNGYDGNPGYGSNYDTVQVELAHWLRNEHKKEIIELLTGVAKEFHKV